jgi:hypothetical protein
MIKPALVAACFSIALGSSALVARAQVTVGPNGAYPQPYSPPCVAPDGWSPNNGHYVCAPPVPSCQFGFATGPVLSANNTWIFSCNGPPTPPPPPVGSQPQPPTQTPTNREVCQAFATAHGFGTLGPVILDEIGNGYGNLPVEDVNYSPTIGPTYETVAGTTGNTYQVACVTYVATGQMQPVNGWAQFELEDNDIGGAGGG